MLKKFTYVISFAFLIIFAFSFKSVFRSAQPPSNVSGAPAGGLCTNCHTSFPANSGGGGVTITGLPSSFQPGQTYPFSVTISHGTPDRTRWGFEINARNSTNAGIGTFDPGTNANATLISGPSEIGHKNAVVTAAASSYTYTGMTWTAPATINAGDNQVNFYVAGNAANNNGIPTGDYIYSNTVQSVLPITLKNLTYKIIDDYKVVLDWQTSSELNSRDFIVEKSDDNINYYTAGRVPAAGNSSEEKAYSFTDNKPSLLNQPIYYRLKMVDADGKFKLSKTLTLTLTGKAIYLYALSPNPVANGRLFAGIVADKATEANLAIVSTSGAVLQRQTVHLQKGNNSIYLSTVLLPGGIYYLHFQSANAGQTIGFVVK